MLSLFDEMNDLLQGALLRAPQHGDFDDAPQVQRSGQNAVADGLVRGRRFAGEIRLVGGGVAFDDFGVQGEQLSRFDEQPHAGLQLFDRHRALIAVSVHQSCHFRSRPEQRPDLTMGAAHRVMLQGARK